MGTLIFDDVAVVLLCGFLLVLVKIIRRVLTKEANVFVTSSGKV